MVGAGLIAVPAVTMLSAAPAYAAASDARTFTITTPSGTVPANGQVTVTVRVLALNGTPLTARPISLVGPSGSTFTPADGVTNGAGTFTTRFRLNTLWAAPGSSTVITAISESGSGSATFTVLGANMLIQENGTSTQTVTQFSSPIVRAQNGPGNELVLLQDGTVWSRAGGNNPYTQVAGISDGADLAISNSGGGTFYVLKNDGTVWAWGNNQGGQLGDGTTTGRSTPAPVPNLSGITKVSAANGTLFAVQSDKTLWALGYNNLGGMAGVGAASGPIPITQVSNGTDVVDVLGRQGGGVLVKTDGTVWAWGQGSSGYNGDGTTNDQPAPVQITTLNNITSLAGGLTAVSWNAWTLFALTNTGAVYAWGNNGTGAYGNNTTTASPTPIQISGISGVTQITTSSNSVFALKNDGTLLKWGGGASTPTPYTASRPITRLGNTHNEAYSNRAYLITQ
ncbi:RCC1 domain-containing protein [Microbacterium sp. BH-3-3-3]|uniref:RCC1 domain-containing protein n=1 Tax=Microbacterium sp. BH-3-3-3 TaxID=1906742 RepID=UPI0015E18A9F|nr:RCC1 domain-containing protein [Microbacterium sp. BH-3-3-3]